MIIRFCRGLGRELVFTALIVATLGLFPGKSPGQEVNRRLEGIITCQQENGHHMYYVEKTCPLGGETYRALQLGTHSTYGVHLDLEPVSYMRFPAPLPVCPSNGFVAYKEAFEATELERISEALATEDYRGSLGKHTSYYLFGRLMELTGNRDVSLWWIYLNATWEADLCARSDLYGQYAALVLKHGRRRLSALSPQDEEFWTLNLVLPNLQRRVGDFDQAREWLDRLSSSHGENMHSDYRQAFSRLETAVADEIPAKLPIHDRSSN